MTSMLFSNLSENSDDEHKRKPVPPKKLLPIPGNYLSEKEMDFNKSSKPRLGESDSRDDISHANSRAIFQPRNSNFGDKRSNVIHTADKFILNEENPGYQLPFVFTEEEIKDAFETLDINKQKFITRDEVSFFLDILGEQVSDAELDEMVRMLDIEGTHKVYLKEFTRMAMGKSLSPIGIAYPPTIQMLQKQNINKMSNVDIVGKVRGADDQVAFIKNRQNDKDYAGLAAKKRAQLEKGGKETNLTRRKEVESREKLIKGIMEETKIDIGKAINGMKLKKQKEIKECTLKMFAHIIERPEDDKIKRIYDSLCPVGNPFIDVREFLTNCVAFNGWTNKEKAKVTFSIFDHENTNQIYFEDFVQAIFWLNFETITDGKYKSVSKTASKIFEANNLKRTDPLSRLVYDTIINEYHSVLFTYQSKLNN